MRKRIQHTICLSSWALKGFPKGALYLRADDISGNIGRSDNPKSVVFTAKQYDNYRQFTGLDVQHTLTFRRKRDAERLTRWLEKCTASKFTLSYHTKKD